MLRHPGTNEESMNIISERYVQVGKGGRPRRIVTVACARCQTHFETRASGYVRKFCERCWGHRGEVTRRCARCHRKMVVRLNGDWTRRYCDNCWRKAIGAGNQAAWGTEERNKAIVERFLNGERQADIANDLGLSRERVRQLLAREGLSRKDGMEAYLALHWDDFYPETRAKLSPRKRWPREGMPAFKAKHGICARHGCNQPRAHDRKLCPEHLKANALYVRPRLDALQARRLAAGLCRHCDNPPIPGQRLCERHRDIQRALSKAYYDRKHRRTA